MGKIYNKILQQFEKNPRGFQDDLGKLAGYSSGSNFAKALREDRNIEKLDGFVKVIETLFEEKSYDLLVEFALELDPKKITIRLLLEYATLYYMYDLVKIITDKLTSHDNKNEYAAIYEIQRQVQTKEITPVQGIRQLTKFVTAKADIRVIAKICIMYCYYDLKNINMLNVYVNELDEEVEEIKNDFLRNSFKGRVFRIKVDINLHTDKIGNLIESLFQIENAPDPTKTMVYLQIGNSYMMKSYDKAIQYYKKALEHKTKKSEGEIKQSINFVSCLWNKLETFNSDGSLSNDLFYYARSGNKELAEETLKKIDFDKLTTHGKAFNCYYRGLLFGDKSLFYKSIEYFISVGEKFYRQLPLMELKKLGENDYVLSALSA